MFNITETWRSLWHAVTTNDRHASHDSAYKNSNHVPIPQSRHAPLTSIATSASESRIDLGPEPNSLNGVKSQTNAIMTPVAPYAPGMRSAQRQNSSDSVRRSSDKNPVVEMQDFADGVAPPPPVSHSWQRIERWLEDHYGELFDNLCEGCTVNDFNELEIALDCTLPQDVRDSLQLHDGQERGGRPTGVLFGCMLLDCEEIVEEWSNWRAVNEQYLANQTTSPLNPTVPAKAFAGPSSAPSSSAAPAVQSPQANGVWKENLLNKQESQPPNAVQKAYAHRSWIPMARDWGGNCVAVDLAPGPAGKWGQVIIFGRDYDCKFVVAKSWAAFLANLADDLSSGDKVHVDEETGELKLQLFKKQGVEPPYLEILRWRCDQRHGRRPTNQKRMSNSSLRINSNIQGPSFGSNNSSPYASPTERSQSPQRSNGKAPLITSPSRPLISSPLARVTEEGHLTAALSLQANSQPSQSSSSKSQDTLISVETPGVSSDILSGLSEKSTSKPEEQPKVQTKSADLPSDSNVASNTIETDLKPPTDEMKTVAI